MFRVDSCKFSRGHHCVAFGVAGNGANGPAYGVVDHNTFFDCNVSIFAEEAQTGDTNDGDNSWTLGTGGVYGPGTTNTVAIEDNVFLTDSEITAALNNNNQHLYGQSGGRAMFRYNYVRSTGVDEVGLIDGHGTYTAGWGRGTVLFEIYSNRFDIVKSYQPFDQRGGTWVFWGNTFTNGNSAYVALWNEHNTGDATGDGITNSFWWQNYRIYSGMTQEFAAISSTLPLNGTYPFSGAVNTNYWMHAPASTNNFYPYTPLVYPHPLVTALDGGGGGDVTAPTCAITSPASVSSGGSGSYITSSSTITVSGTSDDATATVTWSNSRGGAGTATGNTSWSQSGITLASGGNVLTFTATDPSANATTTTLNVTYTAPSSGGGSTNNVGTLYIR